LDTTTGPLNPSPTAAFQRKGQPSLGTASKVVEGLCPSRVGPKNCGQSAAADAGFSERQAKTAQRIATIPEDDFEDMVERGATVTELAAAGTQTREPNRDEARLLLAAVKGYAERLYQINLDEALDALLPAQRAELRALIGRLDGTHDKIAVSI
jgi:hypothetical protein